MQLQDQFSVATVLGHSAFEHLANAMQVYGYARRLSSYSMRVADFVLHPRISMTSDDSTI